MDTKPHALTAEETKEIAAIQDVQDMWGARDADEMTDMLNNAVYAVKSTFTPAALVTPAICTSCRATRSQASPQPP